MKKFTGAATISCAVIALALTACAPQSNENGAASADDAKETPITVAWSAGLGVWHLPCDRAGVVRRRGLRGQHARRASVHFVPC